MTDQQQKAVEILNQGGIIIFPTDTAFGMGCRVDMDQSVKKLFTIRNRPKNKPTPVLCSSVEMVKAYAAYVPHDVEEKLMKKYWPGAVTIIFEARTDLLPELTLGGTTVGLRIPNHDQLREIIEAVGVPIIGTSANFAGEPTPHSLSDLNPQLTNQVDMVLEGTCSTGRESTVINTTTEPWEILRQGAVTIEL